MSCHLCRLVVIEKPCVTVNSICLTPALKGLFALKAEKKIKKLYLVSRDPVVRAVGGIEVLPYDIFLKRLWERDLGF